MVTEISYEQERVVDDGREWEFTPDGRVRLDATGDS